MKKHFLVFLLLLITVCFSSCQVNITNEDIEQYVGYYQPEGAAEAKVYKWDSNLSPLQPVVKVMLAAENNEFDATFKAPNTTTELCNADFSPIASAKVSIFLQCAKFFCA